MRPNKYNGVQLILLVFMLLGSFQVSAQIIANLTVVPADNPDTGGGAWDKICAGNNGNFNQYFANAQFDGASNAGNQWILELSDATGDFTNPVELATASDDAVVKSSGRGFEFSIPTDTRGAGYKLRVRSTDPLASAESALSYSMYYMDFVSNLTITHDGSTSPQASIISTDPITLSVVNLTNPNTYQYQWYKDLTLLVGETGPTLNVTEGGMYFAQIDYGDCSDNGTTQSNMPDVCIGAVGGSTSINPPSKTALCSSDTETLSVSTALGSPSYQWLKDGVEIAGATAATYVVDGSSPSFEGDYQVSVSESGNCPEISAAITFTNSDNFTITRVNDANLVLLPGDTETLSITTNATSPTFQWYRNSSPIAGATNISFDATQEGSYSVEVTQPAGSCPNPTTIISETTELVTPSSFELVIVYGSSYTACVDTNVTLDIDTINAVLSDGTTIDVTSDVQSGFTYQWTRNGSDISGATSSSISVTDTSENGNYTMNGTLNSYNPSSNSLTVQLLTNETLAITSTSTVYCSASDTLTISTSTDLTGESFQWQLDGTSINTTDAALNVTQPGTYRLVIDKNGCDLISNEIAITPLDPELITLDPDGTLVFPEGTTRTVTASGGTGYRWFDANNIELSNTNSVDIELEGDYILIANIDNCEITRQFSAEYLDTFKVPNVITPNGDGFNDQWVLPNSYSNKTDVTVTIYKENGEEVLNIQDYKNDWPTSTVAFPTQNMVFYYVIKNASETLKQGTITVIR
ncbi:gliding motility-associated C-terminal domain-containing protein [Aurantibacter crassamenti]|uniref:T9SS type B sorting domain-containing protein n=1 Tax=Aurantibacter crassamenti TaxID=1837375 RepID=UPI00193A9FF4|nr:gliding motility-associated C-terminal domain-containing protein [Aurantibacter crassamenti]MBM1105225.1 gliding motility-associated C-terminal domain-containing protein [Aurantibacter crassamenti]